MIGLPPPPSICLTSAAARARRHRQRQRLGRRVLAVEIAETIFGPR